MHQQHQKHIKSIFFKKKCVSTQKELERRSEHKPACANAPRGALNEFSQKGSTKKQKTQHTRMYEGHGATKAPKRHKEQVFECESTPKELIVRMRHNLHVQKHFLAP